MHILIIAFVSCDIVERVSYSEIINYLLKSYTAPESQIQFCPRITPEHQGQVPKEIKNVFLFKVDWIETDLFQFNKLSDKKMIANY